MEHRLSQWVGQVNSVRLVILIYQWVIINHVTTYMLINDCRTPLLMESIAVEGVAEKDSAVLIAKYQARELTGTILSCLCCMTRAVERTRNFP